MDRLMRLLNWVGDVTCITIALVVTAIFVFEVDVSIPLKVIVLDTLKVLMIASAVYVGSNWFEGELAPGTPEEYVKDFITSRIATLAISFATVFVVAKIVLSSGAESVVRFGGYDPLRLLILLGLFAFSWYHYYWLLAHKRAHYRRWV